MRGFSHTKRKRVWHRRAIMSVLAVGLLLGQAGMFYAARALSDTLPVTIDALSASTAGVDVDAAPAPVTITGVVSDDLSGFGWARLYYKSPSGHQVTEAQLVNSTTTGFEMSVSFPYHGEGGEWLPVLTLSDASGNMQDYTAQEIANLGFDIAVDVASSTPDTTAPVLTGLDQYSDNTLDVRYNSVDYVFFPYVTDDNAGVANVSLRITAPSGKYYIEGYCDLTAIEHMYGCQRTVDTLVEAGTWAIQITVNDAAGNSRTYDAADLVAMGFPSAITVISNPDIDPVAVDSLNFSPFYVHHEDAKPGGVVVTAQGFYSDAFAGVQQANLVYQSQTSTQSFLASGYVENPSLTQWHYEYLIVTPPYPAEGDWLPQLTTIDGVGNTKVYSHSDLLALGINLKITIGQGVATLAAAGSTLTTDTTQTGATEQNPIQASVTTPVDGTVSITPVDTTAPAGGFSGYDIIGNQYTIVAPTTSAESPLTFNFTLDASQVNGVAPADIIVFRDGEPVEKCLGSTVAAPDPCESAYSVNAEGDVTLTVLSTHASRWLIATEQQDAPAFTFEGFKKPVFAAPALNKAHAGSTIPVKFSLGGDFGLDVLTAGSPTSQKINCTTLAVKGDDLPAVSANKDDLKLNGHDYYRYDWKTLKGWDGTCRIFKLNFTTGETATAYFKF